jgi:hypothetical protein
VSTYSTLQANVADMLNRSDMTTEIASAINRAIAHYGRERFWFNEATGSFSTTSGTRAYGSGTLPSYVQEVDTVELATSSDRWPLVRRGYPYLIEVSGNGTSHTGQPMDWAWYDGYLYLYPTPNATYTIHLSYQVGYTDLTAGTDTNDFTNNAQDLIENRSAWDLSGRLLKDYPAAQFYKAAEMDSLHALLARSGRLLHTGYIRRQEF